MYLKEIRHNPGLGMLTKVVDTWAMAVRWTAQTDLAGQSIERSVDLAVIQLITPVGNEQIGEDRPADPVPVSSREVVGQHATGRRMEWDQARFAELATSDRQYTGFEIHILKLEIACFAESQASHAQ
jgi:hypothetical protein